MVFFFVLYFSGLVCTSICPTSFPQENPQFASGLEHTAVRFSEDCYLFQFSGKQHIFQGKAVWLTQNLLDLCLGSKRQAEKHLDPCFLGKGQGDVWTSPYSEMETVFRSFAAKMDHKSSHKLKSVNPAPSLEGPCTFYKAESEEDLRHWFSRSHTKFYGVYMCKGNISLTDFT